MNSVASSNVGLDLSIAASDVHTGKYGAPVSGAVILVDGSGNLQLVALNGPAAVEELYFLLARMQKQLLEEENDVG